MLRNLGMIGVSWRQSGKGSLADFTLDPALVDTLLGEFSARHHLSELVYIATCNRVELIFVRSPQSPAADLRAEAYALLTGREPDPVQALRCLKAWGGEGAMEHLFLTFAGLDSACVGEVEIAGQVRTGFELARRLGLSGPVLETLFEEAQRVAALVRGETRIGAGRVSLAEIAVDLVLERVANTGGTVALVGVSPMTERAAVSLASAAVPMLVVNRTLARAQELASRHGGSAMTLEDFRQNPPAVEALLSATGSPDALLTRPALERLAARTPSGKPPLLVDMAIPADFDPQLCLELDIPRVGMDEISRRAEQNRAARLMEAAQARELIDEALVKTLARFAERYSGRLFGALQQRYRKTAEEGVQRLLRKDLPHLDEQQRTAVETWAAALARRFAHIPCLGLRGLLHEGPEGSLEAFLGGLEPEFADELRAALEAPERLADRSRAA